MVTQDQMTRNHNTMRKTVILLITLTLVVTSIGAATAKGKPVKPDEPSSDPVYYEVTMDLVPAENSGFPFLDGLSTDETCGADPLVMRLEESRSGSLLATADGAFPSDSETSEPDLYLKADSFDGSFETRCYHGTRPRSTESGADFFRMVFDRDGALEKITWHFDVVMDGTTVTHKYALTSKTKKGRNAVGVEWKGNLARSLTGIVTGSFELWNHTNTDGPVWELIDTSKLEFNLEIKTQALIVEVQHPMGWITLG